MKINRLHVKFLVAPAVVCILTAGCQFELIRQAAIAQDAPLAQPSESGLLIESDSDLPDTYPQASYEFTFRARHGVPPLHWKLEKGVLPPGLKLEDNGVLHGQPQRVGEFQFTVSVADSGQPVEAVQKSFVLRVRSALTVIWKTPAHVNGRRIEGTVYVSNTTPDDVDLTFVVLAMATNGRATAIGYQHFVLPRATQNKELPFGDTLPQGTYVVHVDAVGEVAAKKLIYRDRLQSQSLPVMMGP